MAKKKAEQEKKKSPSAGSIIGTIIRSIVIVLGFFLKIIIKACTLFGLWIPIVYAFFGVLLYLCLGFNPFYFDTLGTLYLCGFIACVIGSAIIAVRNIIIKPAKSIYHGYKHPLWEKPQGESEQETETTKWEEYKKRKREERLAPPEVPQFKPVERTVDYGDLLAPLSDFDSARAQSRKRGVRYDWLPQTDSSEQETRVVAVPPAEKPSVYFSSLDPNVLVHEYSDRFELFKVSGNKTTPIGVEYK